MVTVWRDGARKLRLDELCLVLSWRQPIQGFAGGEYTDELLEEKVRELRDRERD